MIDQTLFGRKERPKSGPTAIENRIHLIFQHGIHHVYSASRTKNRPRRPWNVVTNVQICGCRSATAVVLRPKTISAIDSCGLVWDRGVLILGWGHNPVPRLRPSLGVSAAITHHIRCNYHTPRSISDLTGGQIPRHSMVTTTYYWASTWR